jgi:VCBS repeat-containing protein
MSHTPLGAPGASSHGVSSLDSNGELSAFVTIPDERLLFTAQFSRSGPDLVLTGDDGHRFKVYDYFNSDARPTLQAPNGAYLAPDLVDLLAGSAAPEQYAQAGAPAAPVAIGKVEKAVGSCTVVRNGVSVALNIGDAVYKNDVVQTGTNGALGISFPDGTALSLVANTRMALNDYVYDPNGTSNSALISLVEGTFAFVAGSVAKSGDMKIATPVATMGIRGTTGWVQEQIGTVSATFGNVTYSFALTYDFGTNEVGVAQLYRDNGDVLETLSRKGYITFVTPQGQGQPPLVNTVPMTSSQLAFEQAIIQSVWQTLGLIPNPHTLGAPGSSTPPFLLEQHNELIPPLHDDTFTFTFLNNGPGGTTFDQTGTINFVFDTPPTVTVTALAPDQLTAKASGIVAHSLTEHVLINNQSTSFVPNSATVTEPPGVSPGLVTVDPNGNIVYDQANFRFLAEGQTLSFTITFQAQSGNNIAEETLTFTIIGANDAPVIETLSVADPGPVHAPAGTPDPNHSGQFLPLVESNNFSFTDEDLTDAHQVTVAFDAAQSNVSAAQALGTLTATLLQDSTDGNEGLVHWEFTVDPALVNALSPGTELREVFDIVVDDGHGGTATKQVVIILDGPTTSDVHWIFPGDGNWDTQPDWSINAVPGSNVHVVIDLPVPTKVTLNDSHGVGGLIIGSQAILNIVDGGSLTASGTINNSGLIELNSSGLDPQLIVQGAVTLQGNGSIELVGDTDNNQIIGVGANAKLINLDNIIFGTGRIGAGDSTGEMIFVNDGIVEALGGELIINTGTDPARSPTTTNTNLLEAVGPNAILLIASTTLDNTSGTIGAFNDVGAVAATASVVELENVTITGGTLATTHFGTIETVVDGSDGHTTTIFDGVDNQGHVQVNADTSLVLRGAIANEGKIALKSENDPISTGSLIGSDIELDGNVTLNGGGEIKLAEATSIIGLIGLTSATLENVDNTISGAGHIGSQNLTFINDANGTVDATGHLVIDTGLNHLVNSGLMEATGGGELDIESKLTNSGTVLATHGSTVQIDANLRNEQDGEIVANGHHSEVDFDDVHIHNAGTVKAEYRGKVLFDGGKVSNKDSGLIEAVGCDSKVKFSDDHVHNSGLVAALWGGLVLFDDAKVHNRADGSIEAKGWNSDVNFTHGRLDNDGTVEAKFGGSVEFHYGHVDNESCGLIEARGCGSDVKFWHTRVDNDGVIAARDGGTVAFHQGYVVNDGYGLIEAKGTDSEIDFFGTYVENHGIVEAKFGGVVSVECTTIDNACGSDEGVVKAIGCDSTISLDHATIVGGTLDARDGGLIETAGYGTSTLDGTGPDGLSIACDTHVLVNEGTSLTLLGDIHNAGDIEIDSGLQSGANLIVDGVVTLDSGGSITLDTSSDAVVGSDFSDCNVLINCDNTIFGGGAIGDGSTDLTLINHGAIDANNQFSSLVIDTGCNDIVNTGLLEATDGGNLVINSNVDNFCGTIEAHTGSYVTIAGDICGGGATIAGGTLEYDGHANLDTVFACDTAGALVLGACADFTGNVSGFTAGDVIDFKGIDFTDCTQLTWCAGDHTLSIFDGHDCESIQLCGNYCQSDFALFNDGNGDTAVTLYQSDIQDSNCWIQDHASGHLYQYVSDASTSWLIAEGGAVSAGGYLANVTSQHENEFILDHVVPSGTTSPFWIGASDAQHEGHWEWVDGQEAGTQFWHGTDSGHPVNGEYSNWADGEPNNSTNHAEDYGLVYTDPCVQTPAAGTWNDATIDNANPLQGPIGGYVVEAGATHDNVIASADALECGALTIPSAALLANDWNPVRNGDFSIESVSHAQSGCVDLQCGDPVFKFAVDSTSGSFKYTTHDDLCLDASAKVDVTVQDGSQLTGTSGNDIFIPAGQQACLAGNGGNDTFLFQDGVSSGKYTIADFATHSHGAVDADTIDLANYCINDFCQLQQDLHSANCGHDTVIDLGNCNTITLRDVAVASLQASDFVFHNGAAHN